MDIFSHEPVVKAKDFFVVSVEVLSPKNEKIEIVRCNIINGTFGGSWKISDNTKGGEYTLRAALVFVIKLFYLLGFITLGRSCCFNTKVSNPCFSIQTLNN